MENDWKKIQQKTFTRWVNQRLKHKHLSVTDIATDFSDGVLLFALMAVLSQKDVGKYNLRPRIQVQKMENLQNVLSFIEREEKIRLVNIGAGDIHDGNLKLILGLVWALILHYQISIGIDQENDGKRYTGKQILLQYIQKKIPHKNIKNFTTNWNDGTAVAALVDAHAPGLCPEADTMEPNNALQNATHAMKLAEDWLGIPQVLAPEDMINPYIDELSMMTYLSQFPEALLKSDAPIAKQQLDLNVEKVVEVVEVAIDDTNVESALLDESKVKVYGPGVTGDGAKIGIPAMISIDCTESGLAPLRAIVNFPEGVSEDVNFEIGTPDSGIFKGSYIPHKPGKHVIEVNFNGKSLPVSPYIVHITDKTLVKVSGSGVEEDILNVDGTATIVVDCTSSGIGEVLASLESPSGDITQLSFASQETAIFHSSYIPKEIGVYKVDIKFETVSVSKFPYTVTVCDPDKAIAIGAGITGDGIKVGESAPIIVDCSKSGIAPITGKVASPDGSTQYVTFVQSTINPNNFEGFYDTIVAGDYVVAIELNGKFILNAPFEVPIKDIKKVKVSGSGITGEGARVGKPVNIVVDCTNSGIAPVTAKVTDPSGSKEDVKLAPKANAKNVFEGFYTPKEPGYYGTEVEFDGEELPNSPYQAKIGKPESVRIDGDGLKKAFVGEDNVIDVFTDEAGPGDITTTFNGPPKAHPVQQSVVKIDDNHYQVHFTPQDAGIYEVVVYHNNFQAHNTNISAFDLNEVVVTFPESEMKVNSETSFDIKAPLPILKICSISIKDSTGMKVPHEIHVPHRNLCKVHFIPKSPTKHTVSIKIADKELQESPYYVQVEDSSQNNDLGSCDVTCQGEGLTRALVNQKGEFEVRKNGYNGDIAISMEGPGDVVCNMNNEDGIVKVNYVSQLPGMYKITVKCEATDIVVNGSPFLVNVVESDTVEQVLLSNYNQKPLQNPQYSITAPLHIITLMILVGMMDHAATVL